MNKKSLLIGIVFDSKDEYVHFPKTSSDQFDEFEPISTIEAMENAILELGHKPIRIGGPLKLFSKKPEVDFIWNIGEGFGTRNREAWAPVLAELFEIPMIGSDALTLSISLDKARTKQIAKSIGIPTSEWEIASYSNQQLPDWFIFPAFVKPRYEGTAKGIQKSSIAQNPHELVTEIWRQWEIYQQDLIIEPLLSGAEFTCALSGFPLKVHTVLERGIDKDSKIGIHALESKGIVIDDYQLSNSINHKLEQAIQVWSQQLCKEMEVLDFARLDFKSDKNGNVQFLEINTLPTFAIDNTFAILAELEGVSYSTFLAKILNSALKRLNFE